MVNIRNFSNLEKIYSLRIYLLENDYKDLFWKAIYFFKAITLNILQTVFVNVCLVNQTVSAMNVSEKTNISSNVIGECVELPIYNDNRSFCGILKPWVTRMSMTSVFVLASISSGAAWAISSHVIWKLYKLENTSIFIRLFTIGKIVYDAIDVTINSHLFAQLEQGDVLYKDVYRNKHVVNSILAFAFLGALKIAFWLPVLSLIKSHHYNPKSLAFTKRDMFAITFLSEDGPELFLEYFYIEKFFTMQEAWYLIAKDVVVAIIAAVIILEEVWSCFSSSILWMPLSLFNICISTLMVIRVAGAMYQYNTGRLDRSCLAVVDGALVQTPFVKGCLREIDYAILVFLGMSGLTSLLMMGFVIYVLCYK